MLQQMTSGQWLEECYDRTSVKLWRYIYAILKNEDDAYDVLQSAYIRMIDCAGRVQHLPADEMDAYLFVTARNLAFKYRAGRRRMVPTDKMDCIAVRSGPETELEDRQLRGMRRKALRMALSRLPENYFQFISMKFFGQMNNEEIAQALHMKAGSVRMLQSRAIRYVRKVYQECWKPL